MNKFINLGFYFDAFPKEIHPPTMYLILGIFSLFFLLGIASLFLASKKEKTDKIIAGFLGKLSNWGLWTGIIGLLIAFFRYQRAPYLGMRSWLTVWFLITVIWLGFIIKYLIKDVPQLKKAKLNKAEFNKYLP